MERQFSALYDQSLMAAAPAMRAVRFTLYGFVEYLSFLRSSMISSGPTA